MNAQIFTADDVRDLAQSPSDNTKKKLIEKLVDGIEGNKLANEETLIANDILRMLAADISIAIREAISQKFAGSNFLPHDIALKLAHDLEDVVALPMIERSGALNEQELLDILETSSAQRQMAVAKRQNLSKNISAHIAHKTHPEIIETLVRNKTSELPENISQIILSRYQDNENLLRAMVQSKRVNLEQAHDMLTRVSEDMRKLIIVEYNIPGTTVNNLIHDSKEWVVLSLLKSHADDFPGSPSVTQMINKLQHDGELSFSILIKGLSVGNLVFFEAALARIAGIPLENARTLLWESGSSKGYEAIYEKCKFPSSMIEAMWQLINIVREEKEIVSRESLPERIHYKLIKASQNQEVRNLDYLVTIVAHNIRKLKKAA